MLNSTVAPLHVKPKPGRILRNLKPRELVDYDPTQLFDDCKKSASGNCQSKSKQQYDDEDAGDSNEFGGDGGPGSATTITHSKHKFVGDPERALIGHIIREGKLDVDLQGLREEFFDADNFEIIHAAYNISRKNAPVTAQKLDKYAEVNQHICAFGIEELEELKAEPPVVGGQEACVEEILRRGMLQVMRECRSSLKHAIQHGSTEKMLVAIRKLQENAGWASASAGPQMEPLEELMAAEIKVEWLIEHVMAHGQPMIFGALSKTLKTLLMMEMAVCLASGKPFLNQEKFVVANPAPVAIFSGESQRPVIQQNFRRILKSKGLGTAGKLPIHIQYYAPTISDGEVLAGLRTMIRRLGIKVLFIDPAYMSLDVRTAERSGTVAVMGAMLKGLTALGQESGCTICMLHHYAKTTPIDKKDPCKLENLSGSGWQEFARQWLLIERREPYDDDGRHKLVVRLGGSAGHSDRYVFDVDEGVPGSEERKWGISDFKTWKQHQADAMESQEATKASADAKEYHQRWSQLQLVLGQGPRTRTSLEKKAPGWNRTSLNKWLAIFENDGQIAKCEIHLNGRAYDGFMLAENKG